MPVTREVDEETDENSDEDINDYEEESSFTKSLVYYFIICAPGMAHGAVNGSPRSLPSSHPPFKRSSDHAGQH